MPDSDQHPSVGRRTGEHDAALLVLDKSVRVLAERLSEYCERVDRRLAQGDTEIALLKERQNNHGALIGSMQVQLNGLRQDHESTACRDCHDRIKSLEAAETRRAEREAVAASGALRAIIIPAALQILVALIITGSVLAYAKAMLAGVQKAAGG